MAITNYGELKAAIAQWMARTDIGGAIPDFITLAHSDFNRRLRLRDMETIASIAPVDGLYALPSDYLTYRSVVLETNPRCTLEQVSTDYLNARYGDRAVGGPPNVFAVVGGSIRVAPVSPSNIEVRYYQHIPDLENDVDTNWLLTKEPELYLFASLAQACIYTRQNERGLLFKARAEEIINGLMAENTLAVRANGGARIKGPTP